MILNAQTCVFMICIKRAPKH